MASSYSCMQNLQVIDESQARDLYVRDGYFESLDGVFILASYSAKLEVSNEF